MSKVGTFVGMGLMSVNKKVLHSIHTLRVKQHVPLQYSVALLFRAVIIWTSTLTRDGRAWRPATWPHTCTLRLPSFFPQGLQIPAIVRGAQVSGKNRQGPRSSFEPLSSFYDRKYHKLWWRGVHADSVSTKQHAIVPGALDVCPLY